MNMIERNQFWIQQGLNNFNSSITEFGDEEVVVTRAIVCYHPVEIFSYDHFVIKPTYVTVSLVWNKRSTEDLRTIRKEVRENHVFNHFQSLSFKKGPLSSFFVKP